MDIDHKHAFDGKQDRNYHQKPFDDVSDELGQIDEASARLGDKNTGDVSPDKNQSTEFASEINEDDVRDQHDSTKDWEAENSRTSRHK